MEVKKKEKKKKERKKGKFDRNAGAQQRGWGLSQQWKVWLDITFTCPPISKI